jgi:nitrogen PTS system EIIA component
VTPIAKLLSLEDICLDVEAVTKGQLLEEVGRHMERLHGLSRDWVVQSLLRREQVGSTGVGEGVAIPHARVRGLHQILAAYLRLRTPIPFGAPDGEPVTHIIVLLVPKEACEEHLQVLAAVTQLFSNSLFRERLEVCGDPHQVLALVATYPDVLSP